MPEILFSAPLGVISTPLGFVSSLCIVFIQAVSFLVLFYAAYDYNKIINARAHFFSAMGVSSGQYSVSSKRYLLVTYVVMVIVATLAFDVLFLLQPHLL